MSPKRSEQPTFLLIGHFPPPVHGMAVAMDALGDLLATQGPVVRLRTVPRHLVPRNFYHISRVVRVSSALVSLALIRRRSSVALFSVDAGRGMAYTIILGLAARCLRFSLSFDHHSYAYISEPSKSMAMLVSVAGKSAIHIFKCELARNEFKRIYTSAASTRVISGAYALGNPAHVAVRKTIPGHSLTLGHLSNLSMEKGLEDVVRFGKEAMRHGLASKVILAGRVTSARERALVNFAVAGGYAEYRGPLSSDEKEAFFRDVDVFLFPSRYRNELAPAVVWEALLRGVPVIAYRAGCLTQDAVGPGSLVIEPRADFVRLGLQRLEEWVRSPTALSRARTDSIRRATAERQRAIEEVLSTRRQLLAHKR